MSTPNPQPGPIAQQLVKIQANEQQPPAGATNDLHPSQGKPQKRAAHWTGFTGKTLWDWLKVVFIPVVIALATIGLGWQQNQLSQNQHDNDQRIAQQQHESDQSIAQDQQRQTVLQTYEDSIKDLLLSKGLQASKPGDAVRSVARAETLAALRQLDEARKGLLIQFLHEANLIIQRPNRDAIIPLNKADLTGADLSYADLTGANLHHADLSRATLSYANLTGATLTLANLRKTNFDGANLSKVDLRVADLSGAYLSGVDLSEATLTDANLTGANLSYTDLHGVDLSRADLSGANLSRATLRGTDLREVDLSRADLFKADLSEADLTGANLSGTIMPDGSTHP